MKKIEFATNEEYIKAQRDVTLSKLKRNAPCFTNAAVALKVTYHWQSIRGYPVGLGICHGVQGGGELELMRSHLGGEWIGTDIVPEACKNPSIMCHDFHRVRQDWVAKFDVVYSNALDHAHTPEVALRAWQSSLKLRGVMFIEWTPWHSRLSRHGWKSDCFAADQHEYWEMLTGIGEVDMLHVPDDGFSRTIFAVR